MRFYQEEQSKKEISVSINKNLEKRKYSLNKEKQSK